jgi:hypothetical protein
VGIPEKVGAHAARTIENPPAACVTGGFLFFFVPKFSTSVPHCFRSVPLSFRFRSTGVPPALHRLPQFSAGLPPAFRHSSAPFHLRSAMVPRWFRSRELARLRAGLELSGNNVSVLVFF